MQLQTVLNYTILDNEDILKNDDEWFEFSLEDFEDFQEELDFIIETENHLVLVEDITVQEALIIFGENNIGWVRNPDYTYLADQNESNEDETYDWFWRLDVKNHIWESNPKNLILRDTFLD